ncbi:MAG: TIGR00159 family protein [Ignavibacteriaceae bacterium]|nr:diadenylate cyclase CdaA [Ignavibacteriaceae bacterium]NUM71482.1 TIGR00159 family protein [Ignavibacteriaceae bacterium]
MLEIFKVGFLSFTLLDLLDITVVAFIIYNLYRLIKGTIAAQILVGLIIVLILSISAQAVNLKAISLLLKFITDIWLIAFIIIFQPEIRRLLVILATNPLLKFSSKQQNIENENVTAIVEASFQLSQLQYGALIVLIKTSGMRGFNETGTIINARLSKELLVSIFFPRSPLHDGAAVVNGDLIEAAKCTLPMAQITDLQGVPFGMRHRAAIGISEQADVLVIVVSEESGLISVAENGKLERGFSKEQLRKRVNDAMRVGRKEGSLLSLFKKS